MSSLFGAMAGAAANAMEGAAIGRAIGSANDRANHAENQLELWYNHAKKLEVMVDNLRIDLKNSEDARVDLAAKLKKAEKELVDYQNLAQGVIHEDGRTLSVNVDYGREIKARLRQMEKGLQHSSADRISINYILNVYKELFGDFSVLTASGVIAPDVKEKAEAVWTAFMNGEKLTDSKPIQDLIDKAPMPDKKHPVII